MNIVKGFTHFIRRTPSSQNDGLDLMLPMDHVSGPALKIRFSEDGDEASLHLLWQRYEKVLHKEEKRGILFVFLKEFIRIFKMWEPDNSFLFCKDPHSTSAIAEHLSHDNSAGCTYGHPSEVILVLSEEILQLIASVNDINNCSFHSTEDALDICSLKIISEAFPVLEALTIMTRSIYNCKILGLYGGIQKLTALMKAAVVQLKTITSSVSSHENVSSLFAEMNGYLQKVLEYVAIAIFRFVGGVPRRSFSEEYTPLFKIILSDVLDTPPSENRKHWHFDAIVYVMESGGFNWLVELLRMMRRLSMKELWTNFSLHCLTLQTLTLALSQNQRAQHHFRSIGGIEVLLDGSGLLANYLLSFPKSTSSSSERYQLPIFCVFQLHILTLVALREAIFGNLSNLQFISENGRVHKLASSFCLPALMLEDCVDSGGSSLSVEDSQLPQNGKSFEPPTEFVQHITNGCWNNYAIILCDIFCSFVHGPVKTTASDLSLSAGNHTMAYSIVYQEFCVRWSMRTLLIVFPCIHAASSRSGLSSHIRNFIRSFQRCALHMFWKVVMSTPSLIEVLNAEGLWDFLFSENFFYARSVFEELPAEFCTHDEWSFEQVEIFDSIGYISDELSDGICSTQMKVISFATFTAAYVCRAQNVPECSALLDALEQFSCNPVLANTIARSLLFILRRHSEKKSPAFFGLNAFARFLHVVSIQVKEYQRLHPPDDGACVDVQVLTYLENLPIRSLDKSSENWLQSIRTSWELFTEYFSIEDGAKESVLCDSTCIEYLFDLLWEEILWKSVLECIIDLLKTMSMSVDLSKAKLHLCCKFLETFTFMREQQKGNVELCINLLGCIRKMVLIDQLYYQGLFRNGQCFLHIVSLLNGDLDKGSGEILVLNVLDTLTCLLARNDASKEAFRSLVGDGYKTLQKLLSDFHCEPVFNNLLDMLVDGKFNAEVNARIKNEDVIVLFFSFLQKSAPSLQHHGLDLFHHLLGISFSNRASCVRAGMLNFLLDWLPRECDESIILKVTHLIQIIGGHSISGKEIRKIFSILRGGKFGDSQKYFRLLISGFSSMLNERGPTGFFDFDGISSGIAIRTPLQWPVNKGFSFSCWFRVEVFPDSEVMTLFSFFTQNGKGCCAMLGKENLIYEACGAKRQLVMLSAPFSKKRWHHLCISHTIGRTFSGGSLLKCYMDGNLVSSEKCRYAKFSEVLTRCTIGTNIDHPVFEEPPSHNIDNLSSFIGQIGPIYFLNDAISTDQVQGLFNLGPDYMYSFTDNESELVVVHPFSSINFDAKDGLASKIIFGLNSKASDGKKLFNVSPSLASFGESSSFDAAVMPGTQLCSRHLLQHIAYCVGGIFVFFPFLTHCEVYGSESVELGSVDHSLLCKKILTAEVIELIAFAIDGNMASQQQMYILSGFPILGFILQFLPPCRLNLDTLSSLMSLFDIIKCCGLSQFLVKDAISSIFLNPNIWVYTGYEVQRDLYIFLIQQFDKSPGLLKDLCRLSHIIDIIQCFYWDSEKCNSIDSGISTETIRGERPCKEDIRRLRLLLLSLGEMSLRQCITVPELRALIKFLETSGEMACIEDVLHMLIRVVSDEQFLTSFLYQIDLIGGWIIFINLMRRSYEPIRLLSLHLIGRLFLGLPFDKKGARIFRVSLGKSKSSLDSQRSTTSNFPSLFSAISDRLYQFPQSDDLCATLFDVLLGGASPKQVLRKFNDFVNLGCTGNSSHFLVPQILMIIFRFLLGCEDGSTRIKILSIIVDLLNSNPLNVEALMDYAWNAWLMTSTELDVIKNYTSSALTHDPGNMIAEQHAVTDLYTTVLCHSLCFVKASWQHLEQTVNFLLLKSEKDGVQYKRFVRDLYKGLLQRLEDLFSEDNLFASQPCRDNVLYLLKLVDEMLLSEIDYGLPFPACSADPSLSPLELDKHDELCASFPEALEDEHDYTVCRTEKDSSDHDEDWWCFYDTVWTVVGDILCSGCKSTSPKLSSVVVPFLGQKARDLVGALNIPAVEIAAVVVSGGIGSALTGKTQKMGDKAMTLRGEKCQRIVFRLTVLYLCKASLERASRCVQQVILLLPCLMEVDDERKKMRFQLFIWALLSVRAKYGILDNGTRVNVISRLLREVVNYGKSALAANIGSRDGDAGTIQNNTGNIQNLINRDQVFDAAVDELNCIVTSKTDRAKQLRELHLRMVEIASVDSVQRNAFENELKCSLSSIIASDDSRRSSLQIARDEEQQIVAEKWLRIRRSLIDERGPWSPSPFPNYNVRHWKLDKTEDSWRRRHKLRQNYHFNENLCNPPSTSKGPHNLLMEDSSTSDSIVHTPDAVKLVFEKGVQWIIDGTSELSSEASGFGVISIAGECAEGQYITRQKYVSDANFHDNRDSSSSPSTSENDEALLSVPCVIVTSKRKLAGRLAVMKSVLHFSGEILVEGTGGFSVFGQLRSSTSGASSKACDLREDNQNIVRSERPDTVGNAGSIYQNKLKNIRRHRRWDICKVKAVHLMRYLLRHTSIELFFSDSTAPLFINFESQRTAKNVGTLIATLRNETAFLKANNKGKNVSISFVDRRATVEAAEVAREGWRRREMTNFEYLMTLNTLAGRSYNDLTQYPVFPWIIADYSSDSLDLNKSSTFRDLSKPVGALDSKRFKVFEDRYHNFSDPDIPSFYYGSHYSSMGIVLFFLLRMEPFTALHRNLQGGKFDHADRLFQSIGDTYNNCLSNTSDVKELIPEFFYMPEFLLNSNGYHLGIKQGGEPIADVSLPPWAKDSPEEFINKNKEALECEYVSSNLHNWIDLIFGYKQRGKPAVEAANVFYHLTYEGAVDLDSMDDVLQRSSMEDQIANFGQTPIQLFRKKHPRRGPPIPIAHPLHFAPTSITLTSILSRVSSQQSPILYIGLIDSNLVLIDEELIMSVKLWVSTHLQFIGSFTFSGSQDPYFGIGADVLSPRRVSSLSAEKIELGSPCFGTLHISSEMYLVACGNWENSFQIISLTDGRTVQNIRQHKDVVTCVSVASDGSMVATGSYDTTVMVWEVLRVKSQDKKASTIIASPPFHILCGHDDVITCVCLSVELDIVISGSADGTCMFHTLCDGRYVRSIRHPTGGAIRRLVLSSHGRIVLYSDDDLALHLYTINGNHITSCESNGRLHCLQLTTCGDFLLSAGDLGQVVIRSMNTRLEVIARYGGTGIITSLTVTPEQCFVAGTRDGNLLIYSIENLQLRRPQK